MSQEWYTKDTLEEIYTYKALSVCHRCNDDVLIPHTIEDISSKVISIMKTWMSPKEKDNQLSDILDFIDQNLLKHTKLTDIFSEFISEKSKEIKDTLNQRPIQAIWVDEKENILTDEKIAKNLSKYTTWIEHILMDLSSLKQEIESIKRIIENWDATILKWAKDILKWYNNDFIDHQNSFVFFRKKIESFINLIKTKENYFKTHIQYKDYIYNWDWEYISQLIINEANTLITDITSFITDTQELIKWKKSENDEKIILSNQKQIDESNEYDNEENLYLKELLILFPKETHQFFITNTLSFIHKRITDIINSDITPDEKNKALEKPLEWVNLKFLAENENALKLFKKIVLLKINNTKKQLDKEEYNIIQYMPQKYTAEIMKELKNIAQNLDKKKCEHFIKRLDEEISYLIEIIEEWEDIHDFKINHILPIFEKLDIPNRFHNNFFKIVDIYYEAKKDRLYKLFQKRNIYSESNIYKAYANLINAVQKIDLNSLGLCQRFITYVQTNLAWKVSANMAIEKEASRIKTPSVPISLAKRAHRYIPWTIQNQEEYTITNKAQKLLDNQTRTRQNFTTKIVTPISEELFNETVEELMKWFPHIPKNIKNDLILFIKYYYIHLKQSFLRDQQITEKVFSEKKR